MRISGIEQLEQVPYSHKANRNPDQATFHSIEAVRVSNQSINDRIDCQNYDNRG